MDIYAQNILDRYKEPFYKDKSIKSNIKGNKINHSCGDKLEIQLELDSDKACPECNRKIRAYSFTGVGCVISQASADILGDLIIGLTLNEVINITKNELFEILGIEISERRSKCALLGLKAIQNSILEFKNRKLKT